jgi:hypothetical protein
MCHVLSSPREIDLSWLMTTQSGEKPPGLQLVCFGSVIGQVLAEAGSFDFVEVLVGQLIPVLRVLVIARGVDEQHVAMRLGLVEDQDRRRDDRAEEEASRSA